MPAQILTMQSALVVMSDNLLQRIPNTTPCTTQQHPWRSSIIGAMTPLAQGFNPGKYDVICSRGKKAKSHEGNKYFQSLVDKAAENYGKAEGKLGKSLIVSEIIDTVRKNSPEGGFVKLESGRWFEVGDMVARERTGQSLRDVLSEKYRSSATAKKRRREETNAKMIDDLDTLIESNSFVSKRMRNLSDTIKDGTMQLSDNHMMLMMTAANADILDQLKKDKRIQNTVTSMQKPSMQKPPAL